MEGIRIGKKYSVYKVKETKSKEKALKRRKSFEIWASKNLEKEKKRRKTSQPTRNITNIKLKQASW